MGIKSFGKEIRTFSKGPVVRQWAQLPLRVGFDKVSYKAWNTPVGLFRYIDPESNHIKIERIKGYETPNGRRRRKVERDS